MVYDSAYGWCIHIVSTRVCVCMHSYGSAGGIDIIDIRGTACFFFLTIPPYLEYIKE